MQSSYSLLLRNSILASVDKAADELTQITQTENSCILHHHVFNISIASNVNLIERALDDCYKPVFRWSDLPPSKLFVEGFHAHEQGDTPIEQYCDYKFHMIHGPPPLSRGQSSFSRAFISTSGNPNWIPKPSERVRNIYRYKIFAPGGISAMDTLQTDYKYKPIEEITFIGSIRPCYIHSAQNYEIHRKSSPHSFRVYAEKVVVNEVYYVNSCFSPGPDLLLANIHPIHNYIPGDMKHIVLYPPCVPMEYRDYSADYFPFN